MPTTQKDGPPPKIVHEQRTITKRTVVIDDHSIAVAIVNNVGSVATSAAWPIAAVLIASLFKADLSSLLSRIKEFSGLGIHANLDTLIQNTLPAVDPTTPTLEDSQNPPAIETLSTLSPIESIVTSWLRVDSALDRALGLDPSLSNKMPIKTKIAHLDSYPQASTKLKSLISELSTIKNRVVKSSNGISMDSAKLYVANADKAVEELLASISSA